jgi:DNA modification methylase
MSTRSIKLGDKFQLGQHRLLCGDATNTKLITDFVGADEIKVILTDVPYGVDFVQSKKGFIKSTTEHKDIANDHFQSDEDFGEFTTKWIEPIKAKLTLKNSFYIFNSDKMMFPMRAALLRSGFKLSQLLVWVKTGAVIGRLDYLPQHELIAYGWFGRHEFLKSKDKSVLISPKTKKNSLHPTMKPISILRRIILNSSRINDCVYDPFGGSGSTLIACEQTKRSCRMVELDPHYCQVIIDRWEKLAGHKAKKLT